MPWIARKLRGTKVYARTGGDGAPLADKHGRVDIIYKLSPGAKLYRAAAKNLEVSDDPADAQPVELAVEATPAPAATAVTEDTIIIYTDGACTGNPGPAGLGAVIINGGKRQELSEYLGRGTNNIAELTAILRALQALPTGDHTRPIRLHTDSSYSIGVLTKNWKAKANRELIATIRTAMREFPGLVLVKVKGHAGVPENERADALARMAVDTGR